MNLTEQELKAIEKDVKDFYHSYVQYEWNDVSDHLKKSIVLAIATAITQERIKAKKLLEGIDGVLKSWRERMPHETEERKHNKEHDFYYWSPVASLVDSEAISNLKAKVAEYNKNS